MPLVNLRDTEALRAALEVWLRGRLPGIDRIELPTPRVPDTGGSSETFFLDPVLYERDAVRRPRWVLRVEPSAYRVYREPSIAPQFRVMAMLHAAGAVPVPRAFWLETDAGVIGAPFFLMERVAGETLPTLQYSSGPWAEGDADACAAMWRSAVAGLASIHRVDPVPFAFLARETAGATVIDRELAYWDEYAEWTGIAMRPELAAARRWLGERRPATATASLCWGDARPGNMIFRDRACRAVIDWETTSLGCAEFDLGWWLFFDWYVSEGIGVPRAGGVGDRAATLALWEHHAGRPAEAMDWHEAFATWRFGLIVDRSIDLVRRLGDPGAQMDMGVDAIARRLASLTSA